MSIKICVYKGHTKSCANVEDILPLENIPELPWDKSNRYCIGGRAPRFTSCRNINWKIEKSFTQIVPSNSRPVPLRRNWHAPSRPLPSLSDDPNCDKTAGPCDIDMNNTPLNSGLPIMNDEEYLSYNNPSQINGKVWFYNGPGWKISRVHGKTKSRALPRPIKHWRKQLFPRQKLDVTTGQPFPPTLPIAGTSLDITNGGRTGRLSIIDRPGGAITLNSSMVTQLYEAGDLNTTSCIPLYFPASRLITNCDRLREQGECVNSLYKSRPGLNVKFNKYSFSSSKMYLQSRAKLHEQQATIQFNNYSKLPVLGWQGAVIPPPNPARPLPPSSVSLYLKDSSGCFINTDCSCVVPVSFKPKNIPFANNAAVSSSTNIKRKKRSAITRNQYNVTNKWGIGNNDTLKHWPLEEFKTRGKRRGGGALSSWCCEDPNSANWYPVPPQPPSSDTFIVSMDTEYWNNLISAISKNGLSADPWELLPISAAPANKSYTIVQQGVLNIIFYIKYKDSAPIGEAKNFGFTMYHVLRNLNGTGLQYPLNILNWGGIPFVANGASGTSTDLMMPHFSAEQGYLGHSSAKWTGTIYAIDAPSIYYNTSFQSSFHNVTVLNNSFSGIGNWNVTNVSNMQNTFSGATYFNQGIGTWNVENVTDMSGMFQNAENFNQNLNNWNTDKVENMQEMFRGASMFNNGGTTSLNWGTANVTNMSYMFNNAKNFNQYLGNWDTGNVTDMSGMFLNDYDPNTFPTETPNPSVFNNGGEPFLNWDTNKVVYMNSMFANTSFASSIENWKITKLQSAAHMLDDCHMQPQHYTKLIINWYEQANNASPHIKDVSLGAWYYWDMSRQAYLANGIIYFPTALHAHEQLSPPPSPAPLGWDISDGGVSADDFTFLVNQDDWDNIRDTVKGEYSETLPSGWTPDASAVPVIFPPNWSVTDIASKITYYPYPGSLYLYTINDLSFAPLSPSGPLPYGVTMRNILDLLYLKQNYPIKITHWGGAVLAGTGYQFTSPKVIEGGGGWGWTGIIESTDTPVIHRDTSFCAAFAHNTGITTDESGINNLYKWDVSGVTDTSGMFFNCSNFNGTMSKDSVGWDLKNCINTRNMFWRCSKFNNGQSAADGKPATIELSFNVLNVTDMQNMFSDCKAFNCDLSKWNVGNVTNMKGMFYNDISFNSSLKDWDTSKVTDMRSMFYYDLCFNNGLDVKETGELKWDTNAVKDMSGMFYRCESFNQNLAANTGTYWKIPNLLYASHMLDYCGMSMRNYTNLVEYWGNSTVSAALEGVAFGTAGLVLDTSYATIYNPINSNGITRRGKLTNPTAAHGHAPWQNVVSYGRSNTGGAGAYRPQDCSFGAYSDGFVTGGKEWVVTGDYMNNNPDVFISDIKLVYSPPWDGFNIDYCEPAIWTNMSFRMFSQIFGYIPTSTGCNASFGQGTEGRAFFPKPNSRRFMLESNPPLSTNLGGGQRGSIDTWFQYPLPTCGGPQLPTPYPPGPGPGSTYSAYYTGECYPATYQGTTNYIKIIIDDDTGPRDPAILASVGLPPDPPADPTSYQDFKELQNTWGDISFQCDLNYGPLGLQGMAGPSDTSYNWWYPPRNPDNGVYMVDICDGFIPVVNASPLQCFENGLKWNSPATFDYSNDSGCGQSGPYSFLKDPNGATRDLWHYLSGCYVSFSETTTSIATNNTGHPIKDGASSMFGFGTTYRVTEFRIESSIALIPNTSGEWPLTPGPLSKVNKEASGNYIDVHIKGYRTLVDISGKSQRQPLQARPTQTQEEWVFNSRYIDAPDTLESGNNASRDWIQTALADNSGVAICQPQGTDISSVFITKDAGVTWQALKTQPKSINVIDLSCVCVTVEGVIVIAGSINSKLCLARCKDAFTSSPVWEYYIVKNQSAQATGYWTALAYNNSDENYWAAIWNNTVSEFWEGKYGESSRNKSWASSSPPPSFNSTNFKWTSISIATPPSEYPHAMKVAFAGNGGTDTSGCAVPLLAWRNKYNEIWNFTLCPWRSNVGDAPYPNYGVGLNVLFKKVYSKPGTVYNNNPNIWLIDFLFFTVIVTANGDTWGNMTTNDEIICVTEWPDTNSGQGFGNGIPTIPALTSSTSQYPSIYKKGGINAQMSPDSANFYPNGVVSSISASPDSTNIVWVTTSNYIFNILTSADALCDTGDGGRFGSDSAPAGQGFKWIYPTDTDPGARKTPHPDSGDNLPKTTLSTSASVPALPQFTGASWESTNPQMRSVSMYAFGRTLLYIIYENDQSNPLYTTPWSDTSLNVVLFTNYQTDLPNLWSGKVLNVAKN